jgi:hypothetical protein
MIFTFPKILQHGASGFSSPPKEGVLQKCLALKDPSPRPGLNQRTLSPVTNTLTIIPPKETISKTYFKKLLLICSLFRNSQHPFVTYRLVIVCPFIVSVAELGNTAENQYNIRKEVEKRLNLENVCYHSHQNILRFRRLSKKLNLAGCTLVR